MAHVARKRFGQHFLTDRGVISRIVSAIDPRPGDRLLEIGPGLAALTDVLMQRVETMQAIEIDRDLAQRLRRKYGERLTLTEADVLGVDFAPLAVDGPLRVVGNLPYNISSPLLVRLIDFRHLVVDQHFMLQKEVVDRIVAVAGEPAYGRLGALLQAYYHVDSLFDVPPEAFDPPPRVDSAVFRMLPRAGDDPVRPEVLSALLQAAFGQRRKMLRKTLIPWLEQRGVDASGIAPTDRPEDVPVAVYVELARRLKTSSA